jgi:hypothetical protein
MEILDSYQHRSRAQPAFLCFLPITATIAGTLGFARGPITGLVAVAGATGLTYLIAMFVRDRGRRIEPALWESWGGKPTTQLLKAPVDETTGALQRRWKLMSELQPDLRDPQEDQAPTDGAIDDYVGYLREVTRTNNEYRLVATENAGYGFRRNLLGLRPLGIGIAVVAALWALAALVLALVNIHGSHALAAGALLLLDLGSCCIWVRIINPDWVKEQAFNYARALLGAAEKLRSATLNSN